MVHESHGIRLRHARLSEIRHPRDPQGMKHMSPHSNTIKQLAPVVARFGRDLATNFSAARLEVAQEWGDRLWDGTSEGHFGSSFGSREGDRARNQIHPFQRDSSFTQSASCGQSDLPTYTHPLRDNGMAQSASDCLNLGGAKGGKDSNAGRGLDGVVVKSGGLALTQQAALAVDPLKEFNISKGAVAVDAVAGAVAVGIGGPSIGTTPGEVQLGLSGAKVLQVQGVLGHKKFEPVPTVNIVASCKRACRPVVDVYQYPVVTAKSSLLLCYGYLGRLGQTFRAMQLGIESVLRRLTLPFSILFVPNRVAIRTASFIYRSHVTNVALAIVP